MEIEKALAGGRGGANDSGVGMRLLGQLLSWMSDRAGGDVYMVATANDISNLPPELLRAGRFDAVLFFDLPGPEVREQIWNIYREIFGKIRPAILADETYRDVDDRNWTGAEIMAACRLAAIQQIPTIEAAKFIVPVAVLNRDVVKATREWATGRCLSADKPEMYKAEARPASDFPRRFGVDLSSAEASPARPASRPTRRVPVIRSTLPPQSPPSTPA